MGWGGIPDAFNPDNPSWADEYLELKAALTPEEYEAARASVLNAHYTSPTVIKAIYEAVGNMGFTSGNILEPSCGVGNFFGLLPEAMAASRLYGVELDSITGRIAQQLYPKANILELAPEGTGYRPRTRFAKFFNLPELMNIFKEVADVKTADQLNLPTPEVEYHTIASKPTEHQQEMVKELSERASKVHSGSVDPKIDNMLKITSAGRKLGLDQRIINPLLPDEPGTKVNRCVENVLHFWREGEAEKLTQMTAFFMI